MSLTEWIFGQAHNCKAHGHRFEGRYDCKLPPLEFTKLSGAADAIEALKDKIYVHDICIYCGKIIDRGSGLSK